MKLSYRDIEGFVQKPPAHIRAILVYGPDDGLMRERVQIISKTVVEDLNDPFNVSVLTADQIAQDPGRLSAEANAISMMGGRRLVRIEDAKETITTALKDYLADPNDNALILIQAGDLSARSSLRKLFEKVENGAALPCYVEDQKDIAGLIRRSLQKNNIRIAPDAVQWLASHIIGDRQRARQEIEKLITYMGDQTEVGLTEAQDCCGSAGEQSYDELVFSTAGRRPAEALSAFTHMQEQGVPLIAILRGLQNHFRRLHLAKAMVEGGENPEMAMKKLSPPVFFKVKADFKAQLNRWSLNDLGAVLARLTELEAQCKQTHTPDLILVSQALLSLSCR